MKKSSVISLIRCHVENDENGFRNTAYTIAKDFYNEGDTEIGEYIMSLLSDVGTMTVQQTANNMYSAYFHKLPSAADALLLPKPVMDDVLGIVNAISKNIGVNKFLFSGAPGTGKTEAVKQLGRITNRDVYAADFSSVVDSKLGQTVKNMNLLFQEMNQSLLRSRSIFLFDEIDAIALDRIDANDVREMGRATTAMLKGLDSLSDDVVLVATTNLAKKLDKALTRRFDAVISFDRYTESDLEDIAEKMLDLYLSRYSLAKKDTRLFRKILKTARPLPNPGDLKNAIRTAVAFSDPKDEYDYLRRLYFVFSNHSPADIKELQKENFTIREIAILANKSKSTIDRELKAGGLDE